MKLVVLITAFATFFALNVSAADLNKAGIVLTKVPYGTSSVGKIETKSSKGSLYTGEITGTGVKFRSSPRKGKNVIRTFKKGEKIWVYQTDINIAYNNGTYWSYVQDKDGKWGYVSSKYFATDGIEKIVCPDK